MRSCAVAAPGCLRGWFGIPGTARGAVWGRLTLDFRIRRIRGVSASAAGSSRARSRAPGAPTAAPGAPRTAVPVARRALSQPSDQAEHGAARQQGGSPVPISEAARRLLIFVRHYPPPASLRPAFAVLAGAVGAGRGNSSLLAREFASKVIKAIAVESRFSGKAQRCGPLQGPGCGAQRGRSRAETPPLSPLSRSGIDVVGKRQLGPLYVGLLSFLVPVPSLYKNRAGHGNGASWATEFASGQAPSTPVFREKRSAPRLPPLLSRSGVDVKDSLIRASTRGSFVLPCNLCRHSMYLCRHSVVVGDRRGSRRHLALTNFSRVEWASDIRWSRRFAPVPSG